MNQSSSQAGRLRVAVVTPMLPVPHDLTRGRYIHETARSLARIADVRVYFQTVRYPRIPGLAPRSYLYGKVDADYKLDGVDVGCESTDSALAWAWEHWDCLRGMSNPAG